MKISRNYKLSFRFGACGLFGGLEERMNEVKARNLEAKSPSRYPAVLRSQGRAGTPRDESRPCRPLHFGESSVNKLLHLGLRQGSSFQHVKHLEHARAELQGQAACGAWMTDLERPSHFSGANSILMAKRHPHAQVIDAATATEIRGRAPRVAANLKPRQGARSRLTSGTPTPLPVWTMLCTKKKRVRW